MQQNENIRFAFFLTSISVQKIVLKQEQGVASYVFNQNIRCNNAESCVTDKIKKDIISTALVRPERLTSLTRPISDNRIGKFIFLSK